MLAPSPRPPPTIRENVRGRLIRFEKSVKGRRWGEIHRFIHDLRERGVRGDGVNNGLKVRGGVLKGCECHRLIHDLFERGVITISEGE